MPCDPVRPSFFGYARANDACHWHRMVLPARYLSRDLGDIADIHTGEAAPYGHTYTAVATHGMSGEADLFNAGCAVRDGVKVVWGLDDDYLSVPDWNPAKPPAGHLAGYSMMRRLADHVVVSTPALAEAVKSKGDVRSVLLAPNLIELDRYVAPEPMPEGFKTRILWAGSKTHQRDVEVVVPAVRHVLQKFGHRVDVVWFGCGPPPELTRDFLNRGLLTVPGVNLDMYHDVLNKVRPHITLAPLHNCEFNASKSSLRILEAWAMNSAVIASPVGEYRCVRSGFDGFVAADADAWVDAVERLVTDPDLRVRMSLAGRKRVEEENNWLNPVCRESWRNVFREILKI